VEKIIDQTHIQHTQKRKTRYDTFENKLALALLPIVLSLQLLLSIVHNNKGTLSLSLSLFISLPRGVQFAEKKN